MTPFSAMLMAVALALQVGMVPADDAPEPSQDEAAPQTPYLIDDHLSIWLSLEVAERIIASLEKERRELSEQVAKHGKTLQLMEDGRVVAEGLTVTQYGLMATSKTESRETIQETYDQMRARLTEVDKTLKRRRKQRASLEQWLDAYYGEPVADGP